MSAWLNRNPKIKADVICPECSKYAAVHETSYEYCHEWENPRLQVKMCVPHKEVSMNVDGEDRTYKLYNYFLLDSEGRFQFKPK